MSAKARRRRRHLRVALLAIAVLLVLGVVGVVIAGELMIDEDKLLKMDQTSTVYDINGEPFATLYIQNRTLVDLEDIPDYVRHAFVATEDKRFYRHLGVDPVGILRATVVNLRSRSVQEGGSTITQQVAKNAFLTHERTFSRKIKEAIIAVNLERKYTKEQILTFYMNQSYFGKGAYGIETAAQVYFGKSASELTLGEAALLVGLLKAPNHYSPFNNLEAAIERRNLVLGLMEEQGYITAEQREAASREEVVLAEPDAQRQFAQAFIDYLFDEAEERYGFTEDELYRGGYQIYTTLDRKAQEAVDAVFQSDIFPPSKDEQIVQSGMVILDQRTGGIVAMAGARNYVARGTNYAVQKVAQPGSAFKPIAVYAPALEVGWHPYDMLRDQKITYREYNNYTPSNVGGRYRGQVTMMRAVQDSINAPAVWLLHELGVQKGYEMAVRMGIDMAEQDARNLAIALGGTTKAVSPLEMAQAYTAFANNGTMMRAYAIREIKTQDGKQVVTARTSGREVLSPQSAYYMTRMLEKVVQDGTGKRAALDRPVAGKTGTVALDPQRFPNLSGNAAAWFVGYTPEYTAAVWLGYPRTDENHYITSSGGNIPARIFHEVFKRALQGVPVSQFERPDGVAELTLPVHMVQISDLEGIYVPRENVVKLTWTRAADPGGTIGYKVYRSAEPASWWSKLPGWFGIGPKKGEKGQQENPAEDEGDTQSLPAEGTQLIGETTDGSFVDQQVDSRYTYTYYVVPYDRLSGEEGNPSNLVKVEILDEKALKRYLEDLQRRPEEDRWYEEEWGEEPVDDDAGEDGEEHPEELEEEEEQPPPEQEN